MFRLLIVLLSAAALGCGSASSPATSPAAPSTPANVETDSLLGTDDLSGRWQIVSLLKNGQDAIQPGSVPIEIEFANGRQVMSQGGVPLDDSGYTLDPSTTPKSIDTIHNAGAGKTATTPGIYEVHGDDARLCMGSAQERPQEFASTPEYNLTVLKRLTTK